MKILYVDVTVNLHRGLESGYLDQKELALPQSLGLSSHSALCLLDSNNQAYYPPTQRYFITVKYREKHLETKNDESRRIFDECSNIHVKYRLYMMIVNRDCVCCLYSFVA